MKDETVNAEEMDYYKLTYEAAKRKSLSDKFSAWLYESYAIGNGDMLLSFAENTSVQEIFLREHNLPLETEL